MARGTIENSGTPHHIAWRTPDRLPDGPRGAPILGTLRTFRGQPLTFLAKAAERYGDVVYFRVGPQHMFLLNRPDLIERVLVTEARKFIKSRILQRSKVLLGEGLLTAEGQHHLRQRRLAQPAFHRDRIDGYGRVMIELAETAQARWSDGEMYDMHKEMVRLTLAIVGRTLFNADVESDADEIGSALTDVFGLMNWLLLPYSEVILQWPIPPAKRFERAKARLDKLVYRVISERRASGEDKGDFLSMLMLAVEENESMTDQQVRDEALTLFLAGHETTANLLTWTWYLLSQNPEWEDRVAAGEIEPVIYEALRLYPPAWAIGRMALEDFEADGYTIPAQSIVLVSPYVMHRDARYFDQPERFRPERWTPEFRQQLPKFAFFPFGGGTRVCIGERFAWMEAQHVIGTIARKWRLRLAPDQRIDTLAQITLRPRYGMRMTVHAR
jgi:cytochrome P450